MIVNNENTNRRVLFTALRAGEALEVYRSEDNGEIRYDLVYGNQSKKAITREHLFDEMDILGWKGWQVKAKGLMTDFSFGMAVLDRIRYEDRKAWRKWVRSAGWLQATIVGCGVWGKKVVSLLDQEQMERHASIGTADTKGLLAASDQVRILLLGSLEELTPQVESWIRGKGKNISFIITPQMPKERNLPGVWMEVRPETFQGSLEDVLFELLEGCYPFGLLSNSFKDILPSFQRPHEGIVKVVTADHSEWLGEVTEEILGSVGWDSRWGRVQILFLLVQSSPSLVHPSDLYPLSMAIRQGVPPTCRVMASVKEHLGIQSEWVRVLLLGMIPEKVEKN